MKLLTKEQYNTIEEILRTYGIAKELEEPFKKAKEEIVNFFDVDIYRDFLKIFYFDRHKYINRYPDKGSIMHYLGSLLFVQEPTLYIIRREIVYKSAMIFYKYNILE